MPERRGLEFLVIGAQKAGTTTLWKLLRDHPQLWLPDAKEAPFFSHTQLYRGGLERYLEDLGAPAADGLLRGTVTPHYMQGWDDAPTRTVAERIARTLPQVRLIVLLREPVARARSQHAMALARGREQRAAERALSQSLDPAALHAGRSAPDETNTYVVQGEYGRILAEYLDVLPRSSLHVELSDDLARDPRAVLDRVLRFIGAHAPYEPELPFERAFAGGVEERVPDAELLTLLRAIDAARKREGPGESGALAQRAAAGAWLAAHPLGARGRSEFEQIVDRYLGACTQPQLFYGERVALEFTLRKIWNVAPSPPEPISDRLRGALHEHFRADAEALAALGIRTPWSATR